MWVDGCAMNMSGICWVEGNWGWWRPRVEAFTWGETGIGIGEDVGCGRPYWEEPAYGCECWLRARDAKSGSSRDFFFVRRDGCMEWLEIGEVEDVGEGREGESMRGFWGPEGREVAMEVVFPMVVVAVEGDEETTGSWSREQKYVKRFFRGACRDGCLRLFAERTKV